MQKIELIKIYQRKRALVIDDFPDMRVSVRKMLLSFGLNEVDTAGTGEEALTACYAKHYDIILADYNLGESSKNGQQILEHLRHANKLSHCSLYVMITAETTRDMVFGALESQPDDYIAKPFTQVVLEKRLTRLLLEKQALDPIYKAMDRRDYLAGAQAARELLPTLEPRYRSMAMKLLGYCLERGGQPASARQIYEQALQARPFEWARIGLANCYMAEGELPTAQRLYRELIDAQTLCMSVYDNLAEIERQLGNPGMAMDLLERAVKISPHTVTRQQAMADIAIHQGDYEGAEKALRRVVKLSINTYHDSPDNYFNLAHCITNQSTPEGKLDSKKLKAAEEVLSTVNRRYNRQDNVKLRSKALKHLAQIQAGHAAAAEELACLAEQALSDVDLPSDVGLEMARCLKSAGQEERSMSMLQRINELHGHDDEVARHIDAMADAPISSQGKRQAVELNREGKRLLEQERYDDAIQLFSRALRKNPNHVTISLNLLLAIVRRLTQPNPNSGLLSRARVLTRALAGLPEDHPLYERYSVLRSHVERLSNTKES